MLQAIRRWHILIVLTLFLFGTVVFLLPVEEAVERSAVEAAPMVPEVGLPPAYVPDRMSFSVRLKEEINPYRLMSTFVMPGEEVEFEAVFTEGGRSPEISPEIEVTGGRVARFGATTWHWTAPPEPGMFLIRITDPRTGEAMLINAFVKVPFAHDQEALNGYRIGRYEREPYRNNPIYTPPDGFVEVTPEMKDIRISPHFTLGQFVAKQESGYPKYLVLQERLLLKLEMLLEQVNERDIGTRTFHVMSGFRTPFYNKSIGNTTKYSAHLYGAAADIFIDRDDDAFMDDLNDDGEVTLEEAALLAGIINALVDNSWYRPFIGGLGIYGPAPHRGPFIHVDIRGEIARW